MEKEIIYQVPPEGSLGLLALGHIGLRLWRKARLEYKEKTGEEFQSFYTQETTPETPTSDQPLNPTNET